jgi:polysaccharide pyruvyl transferase WcaK-like protein
MNFIILKRAFNNVGDYLIFERAIKIIKANDLKKEHTFFYGDSSKPLDAQFKSTFLNKIDGIIIPGGPRIRNNMYPLTYPLCKEIFQKKIPIYILGGGTKIIQNLNSIKPFDKKTNFLLNYINKFSPVGCRDIYTKNYLNKLGFKTILNGCPAWYDLNYLNKTNKKKSIKKILFSVPGNSNFFNQSIFIFKKIKKDYPNYKYFVSFNHGFNEKYASLKKEIEKIGLKPIDLSKDTSKLSIYDKMDFHIGYRVHTHIYFLSHKKPSIIFAEDSRGIGIMNTLKTKNLIPGIKCWDDSTIFIKYKFWINSKLQKNLFKTINKKNLYKKISYKINFVLKDNFKEYNLIYNKIKKNYYTKMSFFIKKYIFKK